MDKKEILEKSRRENNNRDLAELSIVTQANSVAAHVGALLCGLVSVLTMRVSRSIPYGPWVIYFGILGTSYLVRFVRARRRSDLYLTCVFILMFLTVLVFFVIRLCGAAS